MNSFGPSASSTVLGFRPRDPGFRAIPRRSAAAQDRFLLRALADQFGEGLPWGLPWDERPHVRCLSAGQSSLLVAGPVPVRRVWRCLRVGFGAVVDSPPEPTGQGHRDRTSHPLRHPAFTRGAYAAVFPPGGWTRLGSAMRAPTSRIHWAVSETSPRWYGNIEGAVRSGEATADAVAQALRTEPAAGRPSSAM
ncbi:FAD-dependent oxidoreductase [Nonomuraea sp. NPDC049480]|uniref:FAD-dependent oxidoreductase n=1 Tax=Nonomuraea sp. NPDC049480 TaxID=3364353 RepID=UPI003788BF33